MSARVWFLAVPWHPVTARRIAPLAASPEQASHAPMQFRSRTVPRTVQMTLLVCLSLASQPARAEDDLESLEQRAFQAAVDRVAPSVLRIETVGGRARAGAGLLGTGPTTGLVIDPDGYVLSSAFSFLSQPDSILVRLPDGSHKPAELVATDHSRMLVLLKIATDRPLAVPEIVPEGEMRVGQWTIAVGRTFEADRPNVSVGILSAMNRVWGKAIQTDAHLSPNNYGGPLVDVRGRVLGLIVPLSPQAATEVAGVEWYDSGIGFAIPAWHVRQVLPRLKRGEDLHPGVIGISLPRGNPSTNEPVVAARHPNSPAREAGLEPGDRILQVDGREIVRASQVKEAIGRRYAGDTVRLVIARGEERIERELKLVAKLEPYERPFLGILPMRPPAGPDEQPGGVTVRYVYPQGPAAEAGLERGDVLVALEGEPVDGADALRRRISDRQPGDGVELETRRGRETIRRTVRLGRFPEDLPPETLPPACDRGGGPVEAPGEKVAADRAEAGSIRLKVPELENDAWAYVPDRYDPAVRHGLIVWLQGPGRFDWDELLARWKRHCDRDALILLAPQPAEADGWRPGEVTLVRKLVDDVRSAYTVDPARIVVHGHGTGGRLAYLVAFTGPEVVRAVAAVDAPLAGRPPQHDPLHPMGFFAAWAKQSPEADRIEASVRHLRGMKYPVTVKPLGDEPRGLSDEELSELVRWIDVLDRI